MEQISFGIFPSLPPLIIHNSMKERRGGIFEKRRESNIQDGEKIATTVTKFFFFFCANLKG